MSRPRGPGSTQHGDKPPRRPRPATDAAGTPPRPTHDPLDPNGLERLLDHAAASEAIVPAATDPDFAKEVVANLKAEYILHAADQGDWDIAMSLAYSNARKAVTALLTAHGWRVPDQPGKHAKIVDAVDAWLSAEDGSGPRLAASYGRARKAWNNEEYPDSRAPLPDDKALRQLALDNMRLVRRVRLELGLPDDESIVPTDDNVTRWRSQLDSARPAGAAAPQSASADTETDPRIAEN